MGKIDTDSMSQKKQSWTDKKIRIGAVSYLNTKPLVHNLQRLAPWAEIVYDLPSRLADDLAAGRLDVALIPSIEFFQDPSYTIVSDACIGCRGPVLSVKLFSRVAIDQIRSLALDEGSRTSAALVRILLHEKFGLSPELQPLAIGAVAEETSTDAVLLIGDRAMRRPEGDFVEEWDLGEQWRRWSELPFVFAMWVARAGAETAILGEALRAARDSGLEHLKEIAEREAASVGMSVERCLSYLCDNLYFRLGPQEQRGLECFYRHAQELGLAPGGLQWQTDDCKTSR